MLILPLRKKRAEHFSKVKGVKPNPLVDGIIPDSDELAGINQQIRVNVDARLRLQHDGHGHWEYEDPNPRHRSENIKAYNKLYENFNYNYVDDASILARAIRETCGQPLEHAFLLFEHSKAGKNANPDLNLNFSNKSSPQSTIGDELKAVFDVLKDAMVALTGILRDPATKSIFESFLAALKEFFDALAKILNSDSSSACPMGPKHQAEAEQQKPQSQPSTSASHELAVRAANVRAGFKTPTGPQNNPQQPQQYQLVPLPWVARAPGGTHIEVVGDGEPTDPNNAKRPKV